MNIQATPTTIPSNSLPNENERRPKGKSVIPPPRRNSKEYPKEKFYSFLQTGVDKFLSTQLGEMDLSKESSCISSSSSSSNSSLLPNNSLNSSCFDGTSFSSLNNSLLSHDLPKILEDGSMHEDEEDRNRIVLPDITKFLDDTDSDDSDDDDDASNLCDGPLNDELDDDDDDDDKAEQIPAIRLLSEKRSEHSLYERRDSSDDGSDWEEDSCGEDD